MFFIIDRSTGKLLEAADSLTDRLCSRALAILALFLSVDMFGSVVVGVSVVGTLSNRALAMLALFLVVADWRLGSLTISSDCCSAMKFSMFERSAAIALPIDNRTNTAARIEDL